MIGALATVRELLPGMMQQHPSLNWLSNLGTVQGSPRRKISGKTKALKHVGEINIYLTPALSLGGLYSPSRALFVSRSLS